MKKTLSTPVFWFAALGLLVIAFEITVFSRWFTGPYFRIVPAGDTPVPDWMPWVLDAWQGLGIVAALLVFYGFVIRPWRRERHLSLDAFLVIAFATLWFQDPLSAYFGHWFTYNTHLVNFGSWVSDVPGWRSFGEPGAMIAEPILLIGPVYVYFIMVAVVFGCFAMRTLRNRWPTISNTSLLLSCFVLMMLVDLVGEGLVWLPLGFWEYPGGIPLLFNDTYHKFPLNEMLTIAASFTAITALRFFKDDRGDSLAERGIRKLAIPRGLQTPLRAFAVLGCVHLALFVCYNLPNSFIYQFHVKWPDDLQARSYLTDGLCGKGTGNRCPDGRQGLARQESVSPVAVSQRLE